METPQTLSQKVRPNDTSEMTGFLKLPPELREQIYELLLVKPRNTGVVTMLSNHDCMKSEVSASQPAISRVNHQLRAETLATFYGSNIFLAEVSDRTDLLTAERWLYAIGDVNIGFIRRIALCGWASVAFGHMRSRRWVRTVLDLKEGTLQVEGNATEERHPHVVSTIADLERSFRALVVAKGDQRFDAETLGRLMDGFHGSCIAY